MATKEEASAHNHMLCCASCGKSGDNLKTCTACKSVKYCGVDCQKGHRKVHKKECNRIKKELSEKSKTTTVQENGKDENEASLSSRLIKDLKDLLKDEDEASPPARLIKELLKDEDEASASARLLKDLLKDEDEASLSSRLKSLSCIDLQDLLKDEDEASPSARLIKGLLNSATTEEDNDDDQDLFGPPPPKEECPLCFIVMSNDHGGDVYAVCCGKIVCAGCALNHANALHATNMEKELKDPPEPPLDMTCPFCREVLPCSEEEMLSRLENRMKMNDPVAFLDMAAAYASGELEGLGVPRNENKANEMYRRAAELGSAEACWKIASRRYRSNSDPFDTTNLSYLKLGAKRGNVDCRVGLGLFEELRGNYERAVKHWMISAEAGDATSLKHIEGAYRKKLASKDQYEKALRAYQKANEDMENEALEEAKKILH